MFKSFHLKVPEKARNFKLMGFGGLRGSKPSEGNILAKRRFADLAQIIFKAKYGFVTVQASLCKIFPKTLKHSYTLKPALSAAFSLVEMLMALLVASLLLAALAPVMTKKFNENVNISGSGDGLDSSPDTLSCYPYTDTNPAWNITLKRAYYANFVIASGGGGGAGASIENVSSKTVNAVGSSSATATNTYNEKTIPITNAMTNVKISTLIGGGGGGGKGNSYKTESGWSPEKQSDCEPFGVYISAANNGGTAVCVSKYNPGEGRTGSPSIPSGSVTSVPADGTTNCASKTTNCCWYGNNGSMYNTARTDYCDSSANGINYSGCYRTVCNWGAANVICSNWKPKGSSGPTGRLPYQSELTAWGSNGMADNKTSKTPGPLNWNSSVGAGLQLCNNSKSLTGAPRCHQVQNRCKGSPQVQDGVSLCRPHTIWSGTKSGSVYSAYRLFEGNAGVPETPSNFIPRSVRCVIEGGVKTVTYKSYGGGSGGSGAYAKDIDISEYVRQAQQTGGGKIVLRGGYGGKGGSSAISGSNSYVYVYDKDNNLIYGMGAYGGGNGSDASTSSSGSYGSGGKCYKYNTETKTWITATCTGSNGYSGSSGSSSSYSYPGTAVSAPRGANSAYTNSGGGSGGTTSHTSGYSASSYGAGGGAGTGMRNSEDTGWNDGSGGSGSGGIAEVKYDERYPAAGGGGGGAGSVVHLKNISVGQNTTCSFVIGKGGEGGEKGIKGVDGGDSYVKCSTTPEFRVNGGKGGGLGKSASASLNTPEGGQKGEAGKIGDVIFEQVSPEKRTIRAGQDGTDGKEDGAGGKGGTSGTGTKGGCGGLYEETGVCELPEILDAALLDGQGFTYNHIIVPTYANLVSSKPSFGTAGAGGGGGGWNQQLGSGKGGNGLPGYVCVYWQKSE